MDNLSFVETWTHSSIFHCETLQGALQLCAHWFAMHPIGVDVDVDVIEKAFDVRVLVQLALLYW